MVENLTLASGPFRSYEHETTGKASLIRLTNGTTIVRLTDFKTSDGPDVKVWLSVNSASKAEGARDAKYVDLGDLKGTVGNQNYPVRSFLCSLWCSRPQASPSDYPLIDGLNDHRLPQVRSSRG